MPDAWVARVACRDIVAWWLGTSIVIQEPGHDVYVLGTWESGVMNEKGPQARDLHVKVMV